MMKMLSWNIRGLGRREKRNRLRKLIRDNEIDVVLIQETKKEVISKEIVRSVWPDMEFDYLEVGARGYSGGLLCIWNEKRFRLEDACCSRNFIVLAGIVLPNFKCTIINVYAPNDVGKRRKC